MNNKPPFELYFHSDPGHSWLEVPSHLIPTKVRKDISEYSFEKNGIAFLEEDCDAQKFLEYAGNTLKVVELDSIDKDHYCRDWPRFNNKS